jgi:chromatin remodeling complex protein RSC6
MSTIEIVTATDAPKGEFSSVEAIKAMMSTLAEQGAVIKSLQNSLRSVLKDAEKNSKELDKLRNKKNRTKVERSPDALPSGITKPVAISDELAKFLGVAIGTLVPRNEVTKGVSSFVKSNGLSDPANKQKFILDERPAAKTLRALLGNPKEDVTYFNLQRYLKHHYLPMPIDKGVEQATPKPTKKTSAKEESPAPVPVVAPVSETPPVKTVKKIIVKKAKPVELTEEH